MNKTYYAIKNQDTGEYWNGIMGGFGPFFDPLDLWGRLDLAREYIETLKPFYPGRLVIEEFSIISLGIVEEEK